MFDLICIAHSARWEFKRQTKQTLLFSGWFEVGEIWLEKGKASEPVYSRGGDLTGLGLRASPSPSLLALPSLFSLLLLILLSLFWLLLLLLLLFLLLLSSGSGVLLLERDLLRLASGDLLPARDGEPVTPGVGDFLSSSPALSPSPPSWRFSGDLFLFLSSSRPPGDGLLLSCLLERGEGDLLLSCLWCSSLLSGDLLLSCLRCSSLLSRDLLLSCL